MIARVDGQNALVFDRLHREMRGDIAHRNRAGQAAIEVVKRGHITDDDAQQIIRRTGKTMRLDDLGVPRKLLLEDRALFSTVIGSLDRDKDRQP